MVTVPRSVSISIYEGHLIVFLWRRAKVETWKHFGRDKNAIFARGVRATATLLIRRSFQPAMKMRRRTI